MRFSPRNSKYNSGKPRTKFVATHVTPEVKAALMAYAISVERSLSWVVDQAIQCYLHEAGVDIISTPPKGSEPLPFEE